MDRRSGQSPTVPRVDHCPGPRAFTNPSLPEALRPPGGTQRYTLRRLVLAVAGLALTVSVTLHQVLPFLTESRCGDPSKGAIGALRTIALVQAQFRDEDRDGDGCLDYASSLAVLSNLGLIDNALGSGLKGDYVFSLSGATYDWQASATPARPWGIRNILICTDGVIRHALGPNHAKCRHSICCRH